MWTEDSVIAPNTFLDLLNEVLKGAGREPLQKKGRQRAIIEVRDSDRVLQILAGPGSGKTEMLVWRILYELFVRRTPAEQIMATTFTHRAATELQLRVVERSDELLRVANERGLSLFDPQVHNLRIGTIHSLCDSMLVEFDSTYLEAGTQVVDEAEVTVRLAKDFRSALGYNSPTAAPRLVNRLLSNNKLVSLFRAAWAESSWPSNVMEKVDFLMALLSQHIETWWPRCGADSIANGLERVGGSKGLTGELVKLQGRWERYLDEHYILDFATIQKRFLERQPLMIARLQHVFVDEFQDSNPIQFAIHTRWLLNATTRLTVVGDDDQAIYRFRGSDINCFQDLEPHCTANRIPFRAEILNINYRSSRSIVDFSQEFKKRTILKKLSMDKEMSAAPKVPGGPPVRLISGPWGDVCKIVANELSALRVGVRRKPGETRCETAAILLFSTSEREFRSWTPPALEFRRAIEARGLRVYNPRSKTAGSSGSPVAMLLGLLSYLIDPVSNANVGKGGRAVMVWASSGNPHYVKAAKSAPPPFFINDSHAALQKKFMKTNGGCIGAPCPAHKDVVAYLDRVRNDLIKSPLDRRRLSLVGLVARLLSFPLFRDVGFTIKLFREALFTQLLEATVAPTRTSMKSLEQPLDVARVNGKYVWGDQYWSFLNTFGAYLDNHAIDDLEVESFEEDAVLLITFHQAKGLEFDHVYVGATGRNIDIAPALRTKLFSGEPVRFSLKTDGIETHDKTSQDFALADREREVYVAITRAKKKLTVLHDPSAKINYMALNPAIRKVFHSAKTTVCRGFKAVTIAEL